jgi:hypothetical protein
MKKLNFRLLLSIALVATVISCKKKGCTDPLALNYDSSADKNEGCEYESDITYTVPSTYVFTDASNNNTVSYGGQTQRMNMLSEIVSYLKTANNSTTVIDGQKLKDMYSNSGTPGWTGTYDASKQLKSKTALGSNSIQALFEGWMDAAGAATPSSNDQYLQDSNGLEWTQMIEKGLMSACFVSQLSQNYLENIANDDNTVAVDASAGKHYTLMEHHWDEAYGYFTEFTAYPDTADIRFWGKYASEGYLENNIGTATDISTAFITGRAAISAGNITDALAQKAIIFEEVKDMVAGMAIHYLKDVISKKNAGVATQAKINHSLSEALAFIMGIQFATTSPDTPSANVVDINANIGAFSYFATSPSSNVSLQGMIDDIAAAAGFSSTEVAGF